MPDIWIYRIIELTRVCKPISLVARNQSLYLYCNYRADRAVIHEHTYYYIPRLYAWACAHWGIIVLWTNCDNNNYVGWFPLHVLLVFCRWCFVKVSWCVVFWTSPSLVPHNLDLSTVVMRSVYSTFLWLCPFKPCTYNLTRGACGRPRVIVCSLSVK